MRMMEILAASTLWLAGCANAAAPPINLDHWPDIEFTNDLYRPTTDRGDRMWVQVWTPEPQPGELFAQHWKNRLVIQVGNKFLIGFGEDSNDLQAFYVCSNIGDPRWPRQCQKSANSEEKSYLLEEWQIYSTPLDPDDDLTIPDPEGQPAQP